MSYEEVLERFHRALIEEIQTQRPEYLTGSFTVAEIYQNLVPYGSHRDRIGVEMNADYEDALLRLLAGEGAYLVLDSEPALRDIRKELESKNPNTGLYREYAAVDVRLNQGRLDLADGGVDVVDALEEPADEPDDPPAGEPAAEEPADRPEPAGAGAATGDEARADLGDSRGDDGGVGPGGLQPEFVETDAGSQPGSRAKSGDPCPWCRAALPEKDALNFCPHCGTDLGLVPCPSCGEELRAEWRFCTSCGTGLAG